MGGDARTPDTDVLIRDTLRDYFDQLREEGLEGLPRSVSQSLQQDAQSISVAPVAQPAKSDRPAAPEVIAGSTVARSTMIPASSFARYPGLDSVADLAALRELIGDCKRCKLAPGRTNLVFGVGNPKAELVFVGEAPGADEDLRGEPFVGRAGQLLTDIIERGMGMTRAEVYICNVIKCRPPGNRNPEPDEVESCEPFMLRQIDLIRPKAIVGLGTFAVQAMLKVKTPISKLRGIWHEIAGIKMMPTFHPAYLLRNPGEKRLVWNDIQEVMRALGRPIPGRSHP